MEMLSFPPDFPIKFRFGIPLDRKVEPSTWQGGSRCNGPYSWMAVHLPTEATCKMLVAEQKWASLDDWGRDLPNVYPDIAFEAPGEIRLAADRPRQALCGVWANDQTKSLIVAFLVRNKEGPFQVTIEFTPKTEAEFDGLRPQFDGLLKSLRADEIIG